MQVAQEQAEPMGALNTVVMQVMDRAGVSAAELCSPSACDINKGHWSRMISGELSLPARVLPWLFERTQDPAILALIVGDSRDVIVVHKESDLIQRAMALLDSARRRPNQTARNECCGDTRLASAQPQRLDRVA